MNQDTLHSIDISVNILTLILLLIALSIFALLAIRSKSIRTFQSQITVFIVVWILGEIASTLQTSGIIIPHDFQNIGLQIHAVSMIFLSVMIWLRFYYSDRAGKKLVDMLNNNGDSSK